MMSTLTEWFDGSVDPVHPGIYERRPIIADGRRFAYWTGSHWKLWAFTIQDAAHHFGIESGVANRQWRGLAVKP